MRFAYADPPYPGQAKRYYEGHPDYAGEVDHAELADRLCRDYPDGWALSTSAAALQEVLAVCPADVRIAVWHIKNSEAPGNRGRWQWSWEPVITRGGRTKYGEGPVVRDVLSCAAPKGFLATADVTGGKPPAFSRWIFLLLGARPEDEIDDLFPGSGAVGSAWESYRMQPTLTIGPAVVKNSRVSRDLARSGAPGLWQETP